MIQRIPFRSLQQSLHHDETDLHESIDTVCDHIETHDSDLHALLPEPDRRDRLHDDATTLKESHPDPADRPPLYGMFLGIKDIIHTSGYTTRAGSALPPELFQDTEASIVTRLRDAGMLILGKTHTTEFAGSAPALTRNPHNLDHTPGGSSSGSAVAAACGWTPVSLGTQTGGSVIRPASFCGIVGFKPSYDRIPIDSVIPFSESLDHLGLFTQDVDGIVTTAPIVCTEWNQPDPAELPQPTLGVPDGPYLDQASDAAITTLNDHLETLQTHGYDVTHVDVFSDFDTLEADWQTLAYGELAQYHNDWFPEYEPFYRTTTARRIRQGSEVTPTELEAARNHQHALRDQLHETMTDAQIDLWVCPAAPGPAPPGITSTGNAVMNRPWTFTGLPALTLPTGTINGLPLGLQLVGHFGADEHLVHWSHEIEPILTN